MEDIITFMPAISLLKMENGAGERAQLAKCLFCRNNNVDSIPRTNIQRAGGSGSHVIPEDRIQRQADPRASQPNELSSVWVSERPCISKVDSA